MLLVVSSSFVSSAFANNIINKLITKNSSATSSITTTHKMTKQNHSSYTDFSGTWMVNCGNGPSISTVIKNSADYITLDGDEYRIGLGLQGKYESNEEDTRYGHISFEWDAGKTALIGKSIDVVKQSVDSSAIETDISAFTLSMKNGQINLDGKWTGFKDVTQTTKPIAVHCVFTKKN